MLFEAAPNLTKVAFMFPGLVRFQLHEGATTLGLLISLVGLGSVFGSGALLYLSGRVNKGEPALACYFLCAAAIAAIGLSTSVPLSFGLGIVGGFTGVVFIGLSTVVVQATSSDEMRARAVKRPLSGADSAVCAAARRVARRARRARSGVASVTPSWTGPAR